MSIRLNAGIAAAAAATLLTLSGCAGSAGEADMGSPAAMTAGDNAAEGGRGDQPEAMPDEGYDARSGIADGSAVADRDTTADTKAEAPTVAVISTGQVALESSDVTKARRDVQLVIDTYLGTISEEETTTSDDGVPEATRVVIRVPSKHFAKAMKDLEGVADLRSSTSSSEDVTTQVIDNEVRLRAQEKSLERIEALLAKAVNLNEVIAIESQLARRQADFDALKSTQAWLKSQTTLSTITLNLQLTEEPEKDDEGTGFFGGLERGWDGLVAALVGLGTLLGLALPFAGVVALLGIPLWLVLRGVRRRPTADL
ncbi:DUF4349 domain-containing protein [Nocardioides cavernaquae]|uniref:DUF4349 domain-containing protein n=1 Tax=Nocardioides cavernaquae TaxID=2321396 RepID=A0A3A5H3X2_9ACTN|nr:DUF4349 domain-containing protein [Nocardioides cavernaquae]RJS45332.1 DUF4349 domain-containing protein [Nocardioides cavernaquae]